MERGRRRRRTAGNGSGRLDSRAAGQAAANWGQAVSQHTAACRGLGEKGMATGLYVPVVCGWTYVWVCEEEGEEEKDKSKRSTRRTKQGRRKVWKFGEDALVMWCAWSDHPGWELGVAMEPLPPKAPTGLQRRTKAAGCCLAEAETGRKAEESPQYYAYCHCEGSSRRRRH